MEGAFRSARPRAESQCLCPRAAQDATERAHHDCRAQRRATHHGGTCGRTGRAARADEDHARRAAHRAECVQTASGQRARRSLWCAQERRAFSSFAPFALLQKPPQTHPARISGAFNAKGQLTPALETRLSFALRDSVYASFPLTGEGMIHLLGKRLLPSKADLSIAGNRIALRGSLGRPNDTLRFE